MIWLSLISHFISFPILQQGFDHIILFNRVIKRGLVRFAHLLEILMLTFLQSNKNEYSIRA